MKNNHSLKILITSPSINTELNIGGISNLTKLLIENNQEVSYTHFIRGKKDFERRELRWLSRQPLVLLTYLSTLIKSKDLNLVHINIPLEKIAIIRDSFLVILSAFLRKKIIIHFHGGNYSLRNKIPYILKILINISIRLSRQVITLGEKEKEFLIENFKVKSNRITAIPNSVNIPEMIKEKSKDTPIAILYIGRIDKNKGLKEMISALEMLKEKFDFKFIIAGDGPDKDDFLGECQKRIPENYEYLGIVSGKKKELVFNKSNIFLLPSYYEGLPYTLLEAMANKLVPIVTPVGSIPEIVEDGKNGFLVPVYDYKAIFNYIIELIENPNEIKEMSQNAYNTIKLNYSLSSYINKINALYSNLCPEILL